MNQERVNLKSEIKARAASLGFSLCGITTSAPPAESHRYSDWISNGYHAGMAYMASEYHVSARKDPSQLFPDLQSIIVLALPYRLTSREEMTQQEAGLICGYAIGEDYHRRIPRMLEPLVEYLQEFSPGGIRPRIFTDSAPILERELAVRAGLGWIGKNSCLITPAYGSAILLAEIFTDTVLEPDEPYTRDGCGTCERCIKACPTGCILPGRVIDSNRCISYHSIENKGEIPAEISEKFTNQVFGCDICQVVCPWNRFESVTKVAGEYDHLIPIDEIARLIHINQKEFDQRFGCTPVSRVRRQGLIRNLLIAMGHLQSNLTTEEINALISTQNDGVLQQAAHLLKAKRSK